MKEKFFTFLFLVASVFGYMQWFFAEQDNQILINENTMLRTNLHQAGDDYDYSK